MQRIGQQKSILSALQDSLNNSKKNCLQFIKDLDILGKKAAEDLHKFKESLIINSILIWGNVCSY